MDDLSPLDANPYDAFDGPDASPVVSSVTPSVTQDGAGSPALNDPFGNVDIQPAPEPNLYDTFDDEAQPDQEEDGGWFNWFSSNVEGINQQESTSKILKAAAEKDKTKPKGVFGGSFGILSPEEQRVWINETRTHAEESVKTWQEGLARTQKFIDEKGATLAPQTRQAVLRNIQSGQASLLEAQQELKDILDVEAGRKPAATLTGFRSGIEMGAQGLIDDVAAGIVKAAGITSHYLSQGDLPQQQTVRLANATWGKILGDEKMASFNSSAPDDNAVYKVGELITEFAKEQFPGDEARQREFSQVLSRGAGNMIGFYGTAGLGALLKSGKTGMFLLTSALGAGVGGSHQFEDATKARERGEDVSELERLLSFMSGAALGSTEAIPIMRSFAGGKGGVIGALTRGAETSAEEAFQEGFQQIGQNLTAQQLYDPNRKISEGVGEGVLAGGILGFLGGAGVQSIIRPREFDPFRDLPAPPEIIDDGQSVTTTRPLPETAPETPTEAAPEGKRGVDVIQFIRAKGGLKPSGELDAVDARRYPGLVNGKGLSADQMREAMVDAGYLEEAGPDQPAVTTPQDVFDLVGRAISGERIVPASDAQADQQFAQTQVIRQFDEEMQAAEQNFLLPEIEAIDAEAGFPVLTEAYAKLNESERAEVVERNARGEDIGNLIEEMAVRNDDRQTIAAMAIRKGLNDQQIGQLRELIQAQSPELAQGFEELLVQLPKQRQARKRTAAAPAAELSEAARSIVSTIESQVSQDDLRQAVASVAGQISAGDWRGIARQVTGRSFPSGTQARDAVLSHFSDRLLLDERVEQVKMQFDGDEQAARIPSETDTRLQELLDSPRPAIPIKRSVAPDYLVSLIDGKKYKQFKRHLQSYGFTPQSYRRLFGLPDDYPMVAPDIATSGWSGREKITPPSVEEARQIVEEAIARQSDRTDVRQTFEEADRNAAQRIPTIEEAQASRDIRQSFAAILDSKTPRSQWAKKLNVTDDQLDPLIEEAIQRKWLRRDKNGNVRRTPKSQRVGNIAALAIGENLPDTVPGEGSVVKTDAAQGRNASLQAAVDASVLKILPDDVQVDVVDNIAIAWLRREDELLALREQNDAFHRWFGDSKVIDENGEPLVVYHGTDADILSFNPGSHFGTREQASDIINFSEVHESLAQRGLGAVYPAYLSIKNPVRAVDVGGMHHASGIVNGLMDSNFIDWDQRSALLQEMFDKRLSDKDSLQFVFDYLKGRGYDGIVYLNRGEGLDKNRFLGRRELFENPDENFLTIAPEARDSWIAFDPTQIKSAIGNRGTFDPTDPRINYALRTGSGQTESDLSDTVEPSSEGSSQMDARTAAKLIGTKVMVIQKRSIWSDQTPLSEVVEASGKKLGDLFDKDASGNPIIKISTDDADFTRSNVKAPDGVPVGWHLIDGALVYKPRNWRGTKGSGIPQDVREQAVNYIEKAMTPKYDYFFRATNDKNEPDLVRSGTIRKSYNFADNFTEDGLSVADGPEYAAVDGYKYAYKIKGKQIGTGSDGEPILDIASLEIVSDAVDANKLVQEDVASRRELQKAAGFNIKTVGLPVYEIKFEWYAPPKAQPEQGKISSSPSEPSEGSLSLKGTATEEGVSDEQSSQARAGIGVESGTDAAVESEAGTALDPGESGAAGRRGDDGAGLRDRTDQRIIRQESASLDGDGNIITGRPSREGKTSEGRGSSQPAQRIGTSEPFRIAGLEGRVTAEPLSDNDTDRGNLARLTYQAYQAGTQPLSAKEIQALNKEKASLRAKLKKSRFGSPEESDTINKMVELDERIDRGSPFGEMQLVQRFDGAWEIDFVTSKSPHKGTGTKIYNAVEKDLGIRMSPSGVLSDAGLAFWQKRSPASVQWHVATPTWKGFHFSPRKVYDELDRVLKEIQRQGLGSGSARFIPVDEREQNVAALKQERKQLIKLMNELPLEARAAKDSMFALRGYHGSPHIFDRFDTSRIGSGEGTQEQGHGLYLSNAMDQGQTYRIQLGADKVTINGKPIGDDVELQQLTVPKILGKNDYNQTIDDIVAGAEESLNRLRNAPEPTQADAERLSTSVDRMRERHRQNLEQAESYLAKAISVRDGDVSPGGALYEVEMNAELDDFLKIDAPLQGQPALAGVRKAFKTAGMDDTGLPGMDGREAYDALASALGGERQASEALAKAGVAGNRYAWGEATNFVVFDDKILKILKRNGEPVSAEERQSVVDEMFAMRQQPRARQPEALGQTDIYNMLISISARAVEAEAAAKGVLPEQEAVRVLRHETVEFFKELGIFTPKEWQLLQRTAKQKGWVETTGVRQAYTDLYQGGMGATELNNLLIKEAIAEQYSEFHLGRKQFTPAVTRVFKRIKDFLDRIANALRGMGFQTWGDIFTKIDQGEFKRRYENEFGVVRPNQSQGGTQAIVRAGQLPDARGRQPAAQPSPVLQGIAETIDDFKRTLGMTIRQGRLDPQLKRAMRAAGGGDVVGQFSRDTGVTRLQVSNDFDALTHEGGHHLEAKYGAELDVIKQQFAGELTPLASPGQNQLSEGFAEFFRRYVTNPQTAQARASGFYNAFEEFLDAQSPETLQGLQSVQQAYESYIQGDPTDAKIANQTVLVSRKGPFSQFMEDAEKNGLRDTMADRLHVLYYNMIGKNHGWWMGTKQMLDLIEQNTGQRIDLKAVDNPNKLLRRINHTAAWARQDLKNGIAFTSAVNGGGVSMHDVLRTAFGAASKQTWNEENLTRFGDYLISRRAVHLYVRHRPQLRQVVQQFVAQNPSVSYLLPRLPVNTESTLEYAPTLEPLSDHLQSLVDHEAANPQFRQAADSYYQFNKDILRFLAEKGLISSEDFTRLSVDTDYAPFQRDMSDRVLATGSQVMRRGGEAAKANKYDVYRAIKGSTRDIINPIQSTVQFVYEMRLRAALNDTMKAMDRLASAAGPGGGAIFERLPPNEAEAYTVQIQQALKNAAKDAGMSDADTIAMLGNVEQYLGNNAATMLFTQGQAKERGERIIWFYEDGKPVPARLGDDTLGRMMFEAFTTMGKRSADLWMKILAIPAQVVRFGVTNAFDFIFRNIFVDSFAAPVNSPYAWPLVTQISGLRQILGGGKHHQLYNRYAGMMGGEMTQSISDQGIDRDIRTLREKGFKVQRPRNVAELFKMVFQLGEFSETATRVGIFKKAFESAVADGMTEPEAAAEAAFAAHDVIDFSRHGSKTEVLRRSVTFMNAAGQGMDKYVRSMTGQGDRGSTWKRASKADFSAAFIPYLKYRAGSRLTKGEMRDLNQSAKAWAFTVLVMGGMSFIFAMLGEDDEMVDEVPDRLKATHWVVSINGVIHLLPKDVRSFLDLPEDSDVIVRLPKPFEMAWVANGIERGLAAARKDDPTAFNDYLKDLMEITSPPNGIPALDVPYEWISGKSFYTGRDIIPIFEQEAERADQFGPYTSEASKIIGDAVNISPYYVDHFTRAIGASIARDIHSVTDMAVGKGPSPRTEEFPVARRFSYNVARNSQSMEKFYDLYYSSEGMKSWFWDTVSSDARSFQAAKNSYKRLVDDEKPAAADDLYQRLNPDQKVFAVLGTHFKGDKSRYRNLHPVENASDGITVANKVMKEIVDGTILAGKREERVAIDRAQAAFARNELGHIRRGFAQNALHIMKVPGWANQQMMDVDKRMATLQAGAPEIYDEFVRRLKKEKFLDFKHVRQVWPDVKERVVAGRDKAFLGDLVAGGALQPAQ